MSAVQMVLIPPAQDSDELHEDLRLPSRARRCAAADDLVEATAAEARGRGYRRLGLLGTGFTVSASFLPDGFARSGMDVVVSREADRAWLHERYLGELLNGTFLERRREGMHRIVRDLVARQGIEAVILAGTELPLLLRTDRIGGLPFWTPPTSTSGRSSKPGGPAEHPSTRHEGSASR